MSTTVRHALTLAACTTIAAAAADLAAQQGTLVVTNKGGNTASIIDVGTGQTRAELPTGAGPHEVAMTADGRWAIATNYGAGAAGNSLTVIDVRSATVVRTVDLGRYRRPHGAMFLPGDSILAVTSEAAQAVVLVRIPGGQVVGTVGTDQRGSHMITPIAADGRAYTSNIQDGTVSELDVFGRRLRRVLDAAPQVEAITLTPDGREVWVGSNARGTVNVIDPDTGDVEEALRGFGWPYRILVTPDNRTVLVSDLRGHQLRIVDRATRTEHAVLDFPGAGPQGIALSDDAATAFLSLSQQRRIAVIDVAARRVTGYIDAGEGPDGIAFTAVSR